MKKSSERETFLSWGITFSKGHDTQHYTPHVCTCTHTCTSWTSTPVLPPGWQKRSRAVVRKQKHPIPLLPRRMRHVANSRISWWGACRTMTAAQGNDHRNRLISPNILRTLNAGPVRGGNRGALVVHATRRPSRKSMFSPRRAAAAMGHMFRDGGCNDAIRKDCTKRV